MAILRLHNDVRVLLGLCALTCCVALTSTSSVYAQATFRDARHMTSQVSNGSSVASVASQEPNDAPVKHAVSASFVAPKTEQSSTRVRPVSATTRVKSTASAPKSRAQSTGVRQTQYAQTSGVTAATPNPNEYDLNTPFTDACPDPRDMPSLLDAPYKVVPSAGPMPQSCPLPDEPYQRKAPTPITFTWKASSLCYKPLYFEDVQLERYGHYRSELLQPFVSRIRFWATIPCLPYLMGVYPPNECQYDLGYYRPGNCAPSMIEPVPISLRGGLIEAGVITGVAAIIP